MSFKELITDLRNRAKAPIMQTRQQVIDLFASSPLGAIRTERDVEAFLSEQGGIDGWLERSQKQQLEQKEWFEKRAEALEGYGPELDSILESQGYMTPKGAGQANRKEGNLTYTISQGDMTLILNLTISVADRDFPFYWSGMGEYGEELDFSEHVTIPPFDLNDLSRLEREIRIKAKEALEGLVSLVN